MLAHPMVEPDKGAGIAMCCTFGDLTDVIWWRELQLPTRSVIGRDGRILAETPPWLADGPGAAAYAGLAGKTTFSAREAIVAQLRESGDLDGEPTADRADGQLLREGRQAARDRDQPAVVHPQRRPRRRPARRADRPRPRDHLGADVHAAPVRELGQRAQRRLADQPAAVLRRAVPGLVPARRRGRDRLRRTAFRRRRRAAGRPEQPGAAPASPRTSAACRAASSADPDIMDTWATSSLSPQIIGGWTRDEDLFARVFPMDLRPQAHDIIRTWLFASRRALALRARRRAVEPRRHLRLRRRPGPQEDGQVQGQRHRADRRPGAVRRRRGALAGGQGQPRAPTARSTRPR